MTTIKNKYLSYAKIKQRGRTINCNPQKSFPCGKRCNSPRQPCNNPLKGLSKDFASWLKQNNISQKDITTREGQLALGTKEKRRDKLKSKKPPASARVLPKQPPKPEAAIKISQRAKGSANRKKIQLNEAGSLSVSKKHSANNISRELNKLPNGSALVHFMNKNQVQATWFDKAKNMTEQTKSIAPGIKDRTSTFSSEEGMANVADRLNGKAKGFTSEKMNHTVVYYDSRKSKSKNLKIDHKRIRQSAKDLLNGKKDTFSTSSAEKYDNDTQTFVTFIHEMGHQVHFKAGTPSPPTNTAYTKYGQTNEKEWFAEHFALWMMNPKAYKNKEPETAKFFVDSLKKAIKNPVTNETKGKV